MPRFNEYPTNVSPAFADLLVSVDVDDTTDSAEGTTKQLPISELNEFLNQVDHLWQGLNTFVQKVTMNFDCDIQNNLAISGNTIAGGVIGHADPTAPTHSVNVQYADANYAGLAAENVFTATLNTFVDISVEDISMTGNLIAGGVLGHADPTAPTHSVNVRYADANYSAISHTHAEYAQLAAENVFTANLNTFVDLSVEDISMTGNLIAGGVLGHADPTAPTHSVNVRYGDANYASISHDHAGVYAPVSTTVTTDTTQTISGTKTFGDSDLRLTDNVLGASRSPVVVTGTNPYTLGVGNYTIPSAREVRDALMSIVNELGLSPETRALVEAIGDE
jgi:ribosome biogenesis SPOUT family RNA methylase Rps3